MQSCAGEPRREVGFCRSMHLGAWLSKLAKEEPGLEEALVGHSSMRMSGHSARVTAMS